MIKHLLSFITTTALFLLPTIAQAQTYTPSNRSPVADSTLGTQVSGTGTNFDITGGLRKGQTLFHSFTDFSVPTNGCRLFVRINKSATSIDLAIDLCWWGGRVLLRSYS